MDFKNTKLEHFCQKIILGINSLRNAWKIKIWYQVRMHVFIHSKKKNQILVKLSVEIRKNISTFVNPGGYSFHFLSPYSFLISKMNKKFKYSMQWNFNWNKKLGFFLFAREEIVLLKSVLFNYIHKYKFLIFFFFLYFAHFGFFIIIICYSLQRIVKKFTSLNVN